MSNGNKLEKFNFFVPATFEKSDEEGTMKISGVCSSNVEDTDGEYLDPSGFDFQPLIEKGYYNWNHGAQKESGAILGRPTKAAIINGGKDFYTEGFLYKGLKQARDTYNLAKCLEEEDPERRLGFSIEGQVIERDPINPKRVTKARITGVAITHCPKNPNTLLNIIKGEYSEPFIEDIDKIEAIEMEKAGSGEGSRGGKVIGHTKSGKPIYHSKSAKHYSDFNAQDHKDAAEKHNEIMNHHDRMAQRYSDDGKYSAEEKSADRMDHHFNLQREHEESSKSTEKTIMELTGGDDSWTTKKKAIHLARHLGDEALATHLESSKASDSIITARLRGLENAFMDKDVEKSMGTGNVPMPESVEGKPKNQVEDDKVLTKSEIYKQIYYLYTKDVQKAQDIYKLTQEISNMTQNTEISQNTLNKAFEILNLAKSETAKTEADYDKKDEIIKNDEKVEKSEEAVEKASTEDMAKSLLKAGKQKGEVIDEMVKGGYGLEETTSTVEKLCSEYSAGKDGGTITPAGVSGIEKSISNLVNSLDDKFTAMATILKSTHDQNNILKGQVEELSKSLGETKQELETVGKTPAPAKSVRNIRAVEKFEKSEGSGAGAGVNLYNLSDREDRENLGNVMFEKALELQALNRPSATLEKAIADLEISKSISNDVKPFLKSIGIGVVSNMNG